MVAYEKWSIWERLSKLYTCKIRILNKLACKASGSVSGSGSASGSIFFKECCFRVVRVRVDMLKYAKTTNILNYFECCFIYAKCARLITSVWFGWKISKRTCKPLSDFKSKIYLLLKTFFCSYWLDATKQNRCRKSKVSPVFVNPLHVLSQDLIWVGLRF